VTANLRHHRLRRNAVRFVGASFSDAAVNTSTGVTLDPLGATGTESFDTDNFHSNVTNRDRFTVPTGFGGKCLLFARVLWSAPAAATGTRRLGYDLNGAGNNLFGILPGSTVQFQQQAVAIIALTAGDFVNLTALQNSGSTITATVTEFTIMYLGA
jgi:hypothetical protein